MLTKDLTLSWTIKTDDFGQNNLGNEIKLKIKNGLPELFF